MSRAVSRAGTRTLHHPVQFSRRRRRRPVRRTRYHRGSGGQTRPRRLGIGSRSRVCGRREYIPWGGPGRRSDSARTCRRRGWGRLLASRALLAKANVRGSLLLSYLVLLFWQWALSSQTGQPERPRSGQTAAKQQPAVQLGCGIQRRRTVRSTAVTVAPTAHQLTRRSGPCSTADQSCRSTSMRR